MKSGHWAMIFLVLAAGAARAQDQAGAEPHTVNERDYKAPPQAHRPNGAAAAAGRMLGGSLLGEAVKPVTPDAAHS